MKPILQVPLRYALYGVLMCILSMLVLFYLGRHPMLLNPVLDARIPIFGIFVFFAIKSFKSEWNGGLLHFWQGMTVGVVCYMSIAFVASAFVLVFASVDDTHFLSEYIRIATEQLNFNKEAYIENIGQETFDSALAALPGTNAFHLASDFLLKSMPIGLFLTIIISVFQRKMDIN